MKTVYRIDSYDDTDVGLVGAHATITIEDNSGEPFTKEEHQSIQEFLAELYDSDTTYVKLDKEESA